jgi:hypothetical protein
VLNSTYTPTPTPAATNTPAPTATCSGYCASAFYGTPTTGSTGGNIGDAILGVAFGGLTSIVGLLPNNTLDLSGITEGHSYLSWVGLIFDMPAIIAGVGIIVAGETALLGFRVAVFLWRLTPFS